MPREAATYFARVGRAAVRGSYAGTTAAGFTKAAQASANQITEALRKIIADFDGPLTIKAMKNALKPTLELAKSYTPIKSGRLRRSGFIESEVFRGRPRVVIGFAKGGNPPYADIVHERSDIVHVKPTRAKFLTVAVMEDLGGIKSRLQATYKGYMRG